MCRLTAYLGPDIPLERIIVLPSHSLLQQSQQANEAKLAVNGDGFGIAWYSDEIKPGLYRDVLPAWSDGNLTSLCRMIKSRLFLAHVRASTFGETSRSNCHPFTYKNWSFAHNGQIAEFASIRRGLEDCLSDELYNHRKGTTDSELFFLLALQHELQSDPQKAIEATIAKIREAQLALGKNIRDPNRITSVFSDGKSVYGFRCSSDLKSPTLYASGDLTSGGHALASEPLDGGMDNWTTVDEGQFVQMDNDGMKFSMLSVA
jgi:predicted glutamine amidotransferase